MIDFRLSIAIFVASTLATPNTFGAQSVEAAPPKDLDELLQRVRVGYRAENLELEKREAEFAAVKRNQQALLKKAIAARAAEERRGAVLERKFEKNEAQITKLEELLRVRLGTMGELFGVVRQVAGDARSHLAESLVSAQFPGRQKLLDDLAQTKQLPSIEQLEGLWFTLQQEMTESGKVVRFQAPVVGAAGGEASRSVVRVGVFNAVSEGRFLRWLPEVGKLAVLNRQPASRHLDTVSDLEAATSGSVRFAIDPSRGSILALLVQAPGVWERIQFGGLIGYLVIVLGTGAFLVAMARLGYLLLVGIRVRKQQGDSTPRDDNPLGRVLGVYAGNRDLDSDQLELKLDEAIMREQAQLERFLWLIKVVSVVAPLMGLLGTVTGMIRTFQAITLFGTGDPKLMAGGISEALVTTMLGLVVAIPLVLIHSWLRSMSRQLIDLLGEQSIGIVARQAEGRNE
ncbi:MAG: MotA/TolQ/ExbB proton channel family protein [Myxococcota bacterium]